MGIVRPVMEEIPYAWAFFVPFIIVTSFTVLNLFIALIVNSMQTLQEDDRRTATKEAAIAHDEREQLLHKLESLSTEVHELRRMLEPPGR